MAALALTVSGTAFAESIPASAGNETTGAVASVFTPADHWVATGFIGSNFSHDTIDSSITFGRQVAYPWRGVFGAEALGDIAPSFKISNPLLADDPHWYGCISNAIIAAPMGADAHLQLCFSGRLGGIHLSTDVIDLSQPIVSAESPATISSDDMQLGDHLGGGFMAFGGRVGFRGDLRWFTASTHEITTTGAADRFTQNLNLDFCAPTSACPSGGSPHRDRKQKKGNG